MPRNYNHIQKYEKEILELKNQGKTLKQIGKQFGFSYVQLRNFITRYNRKQRRLDSGDIIHRRGRPQKKDYTVTEETKSAELRYILERKEARISQLEMENELMRDFLSLTEGK